MENDFDFHDKVVLITGSSGGIGAQTAKEFAKRGASVVITGRNSQTIEQVVNECNELSPNGAEALPVVTDVTDEDSMRALMDAVIAKYDRLDVLVNNAGGAKLTSIYNDNLLDIMNEMIVLNLKSAVLMTQLAAPHLEKTKGCIVNLSSVFGQIPNASWMMYCTVKAAVDMFSKCSAMELAAKDIRVNCVSPTATKTNFQSAMGAGDMNPFLGYLESLIPMKRLGMVGDSANAILFLASEKAEYLTGINIPVDGGTSLVV